jgi:hypothetical protein
LPSFWRIYLPNPFLLSFWRIYFPNSFQPGIPNAGSTDLLKNSRQVILILENSLGIPLWISPWEVLKISWDFLGIPWDFLVPAFKISAFRQSHRLNHLWRYMPTSVWETVFAATCSYFLKRWTKWSQFLLYASSAVPWSVIALLCAWGYDGHRNRYRKRWICTFYLLMKGGDNHGFSIYSRTLLRRRSDRYAYSLWRL